MWRISTALAAVVAMPGGATDDGPRIAFGQGRLLESGVAITVDSDSLLLSSFGLG